MSEQNPATETAPSMLAEYFDGTVSPTDDHEAVALARDGEMLRRAIVCCDCGLVHLMSVNAASARAYFVREDGPVGEEIRQLGKASGHTFKLLDELAAAREARRGVESALAEERKRGKALLEESVRRAHLIGELQEKLKNADTTAREALSTLAGDGKNMGALRNIPAEAAQLRAAQLEAEVERLRGGVTRAADELRWVGSSTVADIVQQTAGGPPHDICQGCGHWRMLHSGPIEGCWTITETTREGRLATQCERKCQAFVEKPAW